MIDLLIDKYIREELNPEEKVQFDKMKDDPNFNSKLRERQQLYEAIKINDAKSMKKVLKNIEKNITKKKRDVVHFSNWIKRIAAILILSVLLIGTYYFSNLSGSKLQVFNEYYSAYPNVIDPITKGNNSKPSLYQIYEMKEYQKVISILLIKKTKLTNTEHFYLASSYLGLKQTSKAKSIFKNLIKDEQFAQPSQWYLALICLIENNQGCKEHFSLIANNKSHSYYEKAKKILKNIE